MIWILYNVYDFDKSFLNDKVSQLEQQQQKQFEALKNYLDENNLLEDLRQKEDNRNNMINEFKDIMPTKAIILNEMNELISKHKEENIYTNMNLINVNSDTIDDIIEN